MKLIKRIVIFLLLVLLLATGSGIVLLRVFNDQLTELLIKEVNKQLKTQVNVSEIRFSILQNFPNVTSVFSNVTVFSSGISIPETYSSNDTLLYIEKLNISISPFKLLRKQLAISRFAGETGFIKLFIDQQGRNNYTILKSSGGKTHSEYSFLPGNIALTDFNISYTNKHNHVSFSTLCHNLKFASKKITGQSKIKSTLDVYQLKNQGKLLLKEIPAKLNISFTNNSGKFDFGNSTLNTGGFKINFRGELDTADRFYINLHAQARRQPVDSIRKFLPPGLLQSLHNIGFSGNLSATASVTGQIMKDTKPHIEVSFSLHDGQMNNFTKRTSGISKIELKGRFENGSQNQAASSLLKVDAFKMVFQKDLLTGDFSIQNFDRPLVMLNLNGNMELNILPLFFPGSGIENASGKVRLNLKISGPLLKLKTISPEDFMQFQHVGHMEIMNGSLKFKNNPLTFSNISASMMAAEDLWIDGLTLNLEKQKISFSGAVKNLLPYLSDKNETVQINGTIKTHDFDLTPILQDTISKPSGPEWNARKLNFPVRLKSVIVFQADHFKYRKFNARKVSGKLIYNLKSLILDSLTFQTIGGMVSGNLIAFQKPGDSILVKTHNRAENVDINQLFSVFNNFGQSFITEQNLAGRVTGDVNFYSEWDNTLKISEKSVLTEGHINIENGRLIQFEPIQELSAFSDIDELKDIRFSRLENDIYINNETITIPKMEINSSAFNLNVSGNHHFSNEYEYHVQILLSELLAEKAREKNSPFGTIEDDHLGGAYLYFKITGNGEQVDVSYDRKALSEKLKSDFKKQGQELKNIFKSEFGRFKNDTSGTITDHKKPGISSGFETNKTSLTDTGKRKKKKFNVTWEEELPDTTHLIK